MLNSNKGGIIHCGTNTSGKIEGIRVNHDDRDRFRCGKRPQKKTKQSQISQFKYCVGVDYLFLEELSPLLPSSLVNINFIPVRQESTRKIDTNHQLYVIRIVIPAQMNTLYYLKKKNICFVRRSEGNKELSLKEVRRLAVSFSEKRYLHS